jgi:hypothetical protein
MKLQKNLLWIPFLLALFWAVFSLFAPEKLFEFLGIAAENANISLISTQMTLGISQLSLAIIAFWMRSIKDKATMAGAMTVVGVSFLLFGLEAVLVNYLVEGMTINMILFVQGIVMILLGFLFLASRKSKEA